MGKRGPTGSDRRLKLMRGEQHKNRLRDKPKAFVGRPTKPKGLPKAVCAVWNRTAKNLEDMGILFQTDGTLLLAYSEAYVEWRATEEPKLRMRYLKIVTDLAEKLGLTIAGRNKLKVETRVHHGDMWKYIR
jgi:phage terminase small subunit